MLLMLRLLRSVVRRDPLSQYFEEGKGNAYSVVMPQTVEAMVTACRKCISEIEKMNLVGRKCAQKTCTCLETELS